MGSWDHFGRRLLCGIRLSCDFFPPGESPILYVNYPVVLPELLYQDFLKCCRVWKMIFLYRMAARRSELNLPQVPGTLSEQGLCAECGPMIQSYNQLVH